MVSRVDRPETLRAIGATLLLAATWLADRNFTSISVFLGRRELTGPLVRLEGDPPESYLGYGFRSSVPALFDALAAAVVVLLMLEMVRLVAGPLLASSTHLQLSVTAGLMSVDTLRFHAIDWYHYALYATQVLQPPHRPDLGYHSEVPGNLTASAGLLAVFAIVLWWTHARRRQQGASRGQA